jgi:uncharacterized SAM-dependent methyltransferase
MKYFKNTELAKIYKVSEKSVRNWIDAAEAGKLDLTLHEERGKKFIANNSKNTRIVEELVAKGKKYKNSRGYKTVQPSEDFYKLYNKKQILDIISNLDNYSEIPIQYTYVNGGAKRWDSYTRHLLEEDAPNSLTNTIELLDLNLGYLEKLLEGYSGVNIIDIGVGNALPVRSLVQHFIDKGMLKRYIGIDISKDLLQIAHYNLTKWFGDKVHFEGHVRDIVYERFDDLVVSESFGDDAGSTANLILFLGGTLNNFREPNRALATIHDSMSKDDLLLFTKKLDTQKSRRYFEMVASGNQAIDLVLDLLNIDKSLYDLEQYFDEPRMAREAVAKLKVALSVKFELNGQQRIVDLNKDEGILLWRARHQSAVETIGQFDENGFELLEAMRSKDKDYILMISKIKTER